MKNKRLGWKKAYVLVMSLVTFLVGTCACGRQNATEWTKMAELQECKAVLQTEFSEIRLRKSVTHPQFALLSEEESLAPWEEFLQNAEIEWVQKEKNAEGGGATIEIQAGEEILSIQLESSLGEANRIRIGKNIYELRYDGEFPFEASWQLAEENGWMKDSSKGE